MTVNYADKGGFRPVRSEGIALLAVCESCEKEVETVYETPESEYVCLDCYTEGEEG